VIQEPLQRPLRTRAGVDEVAGFVVVAQPFSSGDLLCLRCFPASTFGPGYASVWHRAPGGAWTVYTSVAPEVSCPRFVGAGVSRVVSNTAVHVDWTGPCELDVRVPAADLHWRLRIAATPVTRAMNLMMALTPGVLFRTMLVQRMMSLVSTTALAAGRLRLFGEVPNHQWFKSSPQRLWRVADTSATIAGRDLGHAAPLPTQVSLGGISMAQRGLLIFGVFSFEAYDPARHLAPKAGLA
jgi:hypothetical protein